MTIVYMGGRSTKMNGRDFTGECATVNLDAFVSIG